MQYISLFRLKKRYKKQRTTKVFIVLFCHTLKTFVDVRSFYAPINPWSTNSETSRDFSNNISLLMTLFFYKVLQPRQ